MDGDLQDPPEAVPVLVAALERNGVDAVFATRAGRYETRLRLATGRLLKRMLWVLNNDNDIGDYWEWSDTGLYGIDPSNEAYKLGINYMIYAWSR